MFDICKIQPTLKKAPKIIFGTNKWNFATLCMQQPKAVLVGIRLIMVMLLCILMHCIVAEEDGKASTLSLLLVMFALKRCIKLFTKIQVGSLKLRCSIVMHFFLDTTTTPIRADQWRKQGGGTYIVKLLFLHCTTTLVTFDDV